MAIGDITTDAFIKLNGKAIDYAVDENYYAAYLKVNEAISELSQSITLIKAISAPPVSFSQTVSEVLSLDIQLYQFDLQTLQMQSTEYGLFSKSFANIDDQIAKQTQDLAIAKSVTYRGDQRHEFMVSTYFPKLLQYATAAKSYLDIIYPKE